MSLPEVSPENKMRIEEKPKEVPPIKPIFNNIVVHDEPIKPLPFVDFTSWKVGDKFLDSKELEIENEKYRQRYLKDLSQWEEDMKDLEGWRKKNRPMVKAMPLVPEEKSSPIDIPKYKVKVLKRY
jgi:hypothetical protein